MPDDIFYQLEELRALLDECSTLVDAALLVGEVEPNLADVLLGHLAILDERSNALRETVSQRNTAGADSHQQSPVV